MTCGRDAVNMNTHRIPVSAPLTTVTFGLFNLDEINGDKTNEKLCVDHKLKTTSMKYEEAKHDKREFTSNNNNNKCIPKPEEDSNCQVTTIQSNPLCDTSTRKKPDTAVFAFVRPSPRHRTRQSGSLSPISRTRRLASLTKTFDQSKSDTSFNNRVYRDICRTPMISAPRTFEGARFLICKTQWKQSAVDSFVIPQESLSYDEDFVFPPPAHERPREKMNSYKPLSKYLERQQAFEAPEDDVVVFTKRECTTFDDETHGNGLGHLQYDCGSTNIDFKSHGNSSGHSLVHQQTEQDSSGKNVNSITIVDTDNNQFNPEINFSILENIHNVIKHTASQDSCMNDEMKDTTGEDHKMTKKYNRVKLALNTSHAGIFVTGDSQDDPSSDSPIEPQSFETCPSWVDSQDVSSLYLSPHYQPSTSSNEIENTVTLQKRKGRSISLSSTRQRSYSPPHSKRSGYSVQEDSAFEASGRHSNALLSPSFRTMSKPYPEKSIYPFSSDEYLPFPSDEISISRDARTRRRKIADFSGAYKRENADLLSPRPRAESNESGKMSLRFSHSSGDSGLDTTKSATSLTARSHRHRRLSTQSKLSSKSSVKSDNSRSSFLSFLSPKSVFRRHSSSSKNSNTSRHSSRKRLSDFPQDEHLLVLNVSGQKFKLHEYFTSVYPETLLGNSKRNKYFDRKKEEFFFDRDPDIFRHIWNFYYTGKLHYPKDECVNLFVDEISFFGVSEDYFCSCCWEDEYEPAIETLEKKRAEIKRQEQEMQAKMRRIPEDASLRQKIWLTTKHPVISLHARVFYFFSILAIVISTAANIAETIPCSSSLNICKEQNQAVYFYIDASCVAFFTLEYSIRLITAPKRLTFIRQFMSIVDLLAIIPFYCDLLIRLMFGGSAGSGIDFLEILRIVRIVRIFKLLKHSHRLQALVHTFKSSTRELGLIVVIYMVLVTVFSSVIYYAEMQDNPKYSSIPQSMWYAVITTTTTG